MPSQPLSRQRVIDEAIAQADEVGLQRLTLAAVARRLGVRQPSLYRHIDSIDGLRRSISAQASRELGDVVMRATVGLSGPDAIRSLARSYRRWAHLHPAQYQAAQAGPEQTDVMSAVLASFRLGSQGTIDAARAARSTLHGFVMLESQLAFGLGVDIDRSFDRMVNGLILSLGR